MTWNKSMIRALIGVGVTAIILSACSESAPKECGDLDDVMHSGETRRMFFMTTPGKQREFWASDEGKWVMIETFQRKKGEKSEPKVCVLERGDDWAMFGTELNKLP